VDTQPPNLLAFTEQFGTVFAVARQLQVEQYQSFEQVLTASVN